MKSQLLFTTALLSCLYSFSQADSSAKKQPSKTSSLKAAISYSGNAATDGRDYGVQQFAISPSLYYYHKSGLFAGVAGRFLGDADPAYVSTSIDIGYMGNFSKKFSYTISLGKNFINPDTAGILSNSLSAGVDYTSKWFGAGIDYVYSFGDEKAYSLYPVVSGTFEKSISGHFLNTISFSPSVGAVFGTANLPFTTTPTTVFQKGTGQSWSQLKQTILSRRTGRGTSTTTTETTSYDYTFGLMNTALTVPVFFIMKKTSLGISYTYNIPRKLSEEEDLDISPSGYVMVSFSVTF